MNQFEEKIGPIHLPKVAGRCLIHFSRWPPMPYWKLKCDISFKPDWSNSIWSAISNLFCHHRSERATTMFWDGLDLQIQDGSQRHIEDQKKWYISWTTHMLKNMCQASPFGKALMSYKFWASFPSRPSPSHFHQFPVWFKWKHWFLISSAPNMLPRVRDD